jgi:hypothetical protein
MTRPIGPGTRRTPVAHGPALRRRRPRLNRWGRLVENDVVAGARMSFDHDPTDGDLVANLAVVRAAIAAYGPESVQPLAELSAGRIRRWVASIRPASDAPAAGSA